MANKEIILTGIKPTGTPHLGNLVGAIKPVIEMSRGAGQAFIFIADLHALNAIHDPELLKRYTLEIASAFVALGLDTDRAVFFRQSDVPQVAELSTLLMNVTPKGLMNRAHSYKDSVAKNLSAGRDADDGINMGLYTYPVLMAADILLYDSDVVPVGKDQKQHLEFARDIAGSFNALYGETFKLPCPSITEDTGIIPGLDGRKMSKSYGNQIPIFDPEPELKKKIMKIITDSKLPDEPKNPDENTIYLLYRHFASPDRIADMREKFLGGKIGYGDAKKILFEAANDYLAPARERYVELMRNPDRIYKLLADGASRARAAAAKTLARIKAAMKLDYF
jgi:tryptophanyl-tRNA synthetase